MPDRKHGDHWDVQYPQGGYDNVYPDGKVREGDGPRGKFSPAQGPTPCPAPTPPPEESESGGDSSILENGDEIIGWGIIGSILFWVISETSRVLFPPRNLVPVP